MVSLERRVESHISEDMMKFVAVLYKTIMLVVFIAWSASYQEQYLSHIHAFILPTRYMR